MTCPVATSLTFELPTHAVAMSSTQLVSFCLLMDICYFWVRLFSFELICGLWISLSKDPLVWLLLSFCLICSFSLPSLQHLASLFYLFFYAFTVAWWSFFTAFIAAFSTFIIPPFRYLSLCQFCTVFFAAFDTIIGWLPSLQPISVVFIAVAPADSTIFSPFPSLHGQLRPPNTYLSSLLMFSIQYLIARDIMDISRYRKRKN